MNKVNPPKIASIIFNKFLSPYDGATATGDLEEEFYLIIEEEGIKEAKKWYKRQVYKSIPLFLQNLTNWSLTMFKNYLKIAIRTIIRQKGFSFINISGLAIGMACCLLMLLWSQDELNYDEFHENLDNIYRIVDGQQTDPRIERSALSVPPIAASMKNDYPEIIRSTRFDFDNRLVKYKDKIFNEFGYINADPEFFEMFNFPFISGDPKTAISSPNSVVLTREMAEKYFGEEEPMGKTMIIDNNIDVIVTGVVENVPKNSTLQFDFISLFAPPFYSPNQMRNWNAGMLYSFVQLAEGVSVGSLNEKVSDYLIRKNPSETDPVILQWMGDIHLHSDLSHEMSGTSDIKYVYIFTVLAAFVLIIACINFMNLTTARSGNRAKEVGMRKVAGAYRSHLIKQFYGESVLLSIVGLILAIMLVIAFLPVFESISGKQLAIGLSDNIVLYVSLLVISIVTGVLSGSYPALYLSSFQPVNVLKGALSSVSKGSGFRKALVVLQFSLSVFLIVCTLIIMKQLNYMREKDLGYNKSHLLVLNMTGNANQNYRPFREEIINRPDVINMSRSFSLPTNIRSSPGSPDYEGKGPNDNWEIRADFVDYDYFETFDMEIILGRSFSREFTTDDSLGYVVNEAAVKRMGMEDPVGKSFSFWGNDGGHIIGVVKDFHFRSLHNEIEPIVFAMLEPWMSRIIIRIKPDNISETIAGIETIWKKLNPNNPYDYQFYDERFDNLYTVESRMKDVINTFTVLAIFIACLGLFGLAAYMAEQKTKEIGIRKTLGSSVSAIVLLLSGEFVKWVIIANMIAWPAAWLVMSRWLTGFAYRIDIDITLFLLSGLMSVVVALITVGFQTVKAAVINPVDALKYE